MRLKKSPIYGPQMKITYLLLLYESIFFSYFATRT